MDFAREIEKHLQWIEAVASLIGDEARPAEAVQQVSRHDQCALGKWLSTEGAATLGDFPEFEQLEASHKAFHTLAGELISAFDAGDETRTMALEEAFVASSQEIIAHLEALQAHAAGKGDDSLSEGDSGSD